MTREPTHQPKTGTRAVVFTDLDGNALDLDTRSVLAAGPTLHAQLKPRFQGWQA